MAERDWLRPEAPAEAPGTAWSGRAESRFELRPLSLGELLDRTFALYRSRFWLFAGIAMIAAAINAVGQAISLASAPRLAQKILSTPNASVTVALSNLREVGAAQAGTYLVLLLFFLVSAVTQAGTAWAMTQVYLQRPVDARTALRRVFPQSLRWMGIAVLQALNLVWVPVAVLLPAALLLVFAVRTNSMGLSAIGGLLAALAILGGFPLGVVLYLRYALALPAAAIEGLGVRGALRRSKKLAAGTKGRIFVVLLIAFGMLEVVGVLQSPVAMLMLLAPGQEHYLARGIALLVAFVGHTVVAPLALIGLTLVYFDQRVRKEALDLELLLETARGVTPGGPGSVLGATIADAAPAEGYAPVA